MENGGRRRQHRIASLRLNTEYRLPLRRRRATRRRPVQCRRHVCAPARVCGVSDLSATKRQQQCKIRRKLLLRARTEREETLQPPILPPPKSEKLILVVSPRNCRTLPPTPLASTACNAGRQRRAAGGFEDQPETSLPLARYRAPLRSHLIPAAPAARSGRPATASDVARGTRGELHREMTDTAGRAGDQHALGEQRCGRARNWRKCGQTCDRPARLPVAKLTVSGNAAMRCVGHRGRSAQPDSSINATICAPAGGPLRPPLAATQAADVLAGSPALLVVAERPATRRD